MALTLDDCKLIGLLREIHQGHVARGFAKDELVLALGQALDLLEKVVEDEGST